MEITFGTAEELKEAREKAFLELTPSQRFVSFLKSIEQNSHWATTRKPVDKGNFIVELKGEWNSFSTKE